MRAPLLGGDNYQFESLLKICAARLDDLNIPTLIIEADNDPLMEKELREILKATYSAVPVETLSQKGHFPYRNGPDEYSRILVLLLRI